MSTKRISIKDLEPGAYQAMMALENYGKSCLLSPIQKELIKMRASQINGCAYCLDMHTEDALALGESHRRIMALSVWHESHLFSKEERVLLQLTEEITCISQKGLTEGTYQEAIKTFSEKITAQIIMLVITINAWNRIAVSTKLIYKE
ncbi:MAG: carboxymuconolactone decarboxylase family protein [Bacteroidetes bacterium]|nr:carboxymuconolactone decarboxylase family protein [Bacteroidota bacterium]